MENIFFPIYDIFLKFFPIHDIFLKFDEMKYLIDYVWNEDSLIILCKLTISFSAVKLKLGPSFFQFIHRFKYSFDYDSNIGFLSVGLMLYFQVFSNSRKDFGIFECYRARLFNFSQFKEKNVVLPNCYQFTIELGNWDIWSLLDFIFIRLWG